MSTKIFYLLKLHKNKLISKKNDAKLKINLIKTIIYKYTPYRFLLIFYL